MKSILSRLCCLVSLTFVFTGCEPGCCLRSHGICEFVQDSCCVRQGKGTVACMMGGCLTPVRCSALDEYEDVITEDDVLSITLYPSNTESANVASAVEKVGQSGYRVREGSIQLPAVGFLSVSGRTLPDAADLISEVYAAEGYDLQVFLSYMDRLQHRVQLVGAAACPSSPITSLPVDGKLRLYDVLAKCKLPPSANLFESYVLRNGCPLDVDLHRLICQGDLSQNIVMQGGDKIYIAPETSCSVLVMGEVGCPSVIPVPKGFITIREALARAKGIPYTGRQDCIQVIRGGLNCPKIYTLSWCQISRYPNDCLLLIPGDTVYVAEKAISRWNRFVSQILPSFNVFKTGYGCYQPFGG